MFSSESVFRKNILKIVLFSILVKLSYYLFALFLQKFIFFDLSLSFDFDSFVSVFYRNDSGWYEGISKNFYPKLQHPEHLKGVIDGQFQQSEWAFFPAYPILISLLIKIFGGGFQVVGFFVSLFFSTLVFILFYKYACSFFKDTKVAFFSTLLFIVSPFHFFLSVMYTESMFLALILLCIYCVLKKKFLLLPFLLAVLTLTRPNGIIVSFCIYLFFIEEDIKSNKYQRLMSIFNFEFVYKSIFFLAAPIVFIAYSIYQFNLTGDYFAFSTAQEGWEKKDMFPILALFRKGDFVNQFNSIYVCIIMAFALLHIKKIRFSYQLFIWTTILLPLCKGSVGSMTRYISILFPLFLLSIEYIRKLKPQYVIIMAIYVLQLCNFYLWLINDRFSY